MNSLRTCSRTVLTKNLSHFAQAARAACVDIVHRDPESLGDLICFQLLDVGQLEHLSMFVVLDLADAPRDEGLCPLLVELVDDVVGALLTARGLPGDERCVVGAGLALGVEALVQAPGRALDVTELLPPKVLTAV